MEEKNGRFAKKLGCVRLSKMRIRLKKPIGHLAGCNVLMQRFAAQFLDCELWEELFVVVGGQPSALKPAAQFLERVH